jgi:hypothetical protein
MRGVIAMATEGQPESVVAALDTELLARQLSDLRRDVRNFPRIKTSMAEMPNLTEVLVTKYFPGEPLRRFVFDDSGPGDGRMIIMTSEKLIEVGFLFCFSSSNQIKALSRAKTILVDGTFTCKSHDIDQLFEVYAQVHGRYPRRSRVLWKDGRGQNEDTIRTLSQKNHDACPANSGCSLEALTLFVRLRRGYPFCPQDSFSRFVTLMIYTRIFIYL